MKINLVKGTTALFLIVPEYEDGSEYVYDSGDTVRFGVKENVRDEEDCLIEKELDYSDLMGGFVLSLTPEDTAGLETYPDARYWYDIGLQTAGDDYYMLLECDEFIIKRAVTAVNV